VLTQKGEGKMKRNKMIRVVTMFVIAFFAFGLFTNSTHALVFPRSSNVAMVPYEYSNNGGNLYVGSSWPDSPGFTFTDLSPDAIADGTQTNPITAGGYDTVVLMLMDFDFATYWADSDFSSRILNFVNGGGKLILYTSESEVADYSAFVYPFIVDTPGQTGNSGGTLVNVADDTLSSSNTSDASYIDLAVIVSQTDAVGDCTVMTSVDSHWYIDLTAINTYGVGGPAHTYAFYGAGLMIFNGLDIDYAYTAPTNADGSGAIGMIWWRELCGQTLGPGQSVSGLTLTPATATNDVGVMHTVTALVKDTINNPVPSVVVNFTIISGPNAGLSGSATTDSNGEATFSWTSLAVGTDTVQASIVNAAGAPVTTTATKDWVIPSNVIPEVPFGTIAGLAAMCVALVGFAARGKIRKLF
jgi:hypothetical protein